MTHAATGGAVTVNAYDITHPLPHIVFVTILRSPSPSLFFCNILLRYEIKPMGEGKALYV